MIDRTALRAAVLAEARQWIGTPYRHQASVKGAGCDCLGLIRGIWRAVYGPEPEALAPYTPDWAERGGAETLYGAAQRHLEPISLGDALPGDVLLFRIRKSGPMKHCALLSGSDQMIHAYQGCAVAETAITPWWSRRLAAAAQFPLPLKV